MTTSSELHSFVDLALYKTKFQGSSRSAVFRTRMFASFQKTKILSNVKAGACLVGSLI